MRYERIDRNSLQPGEAAWMLYMEHDDLFGAVLLKRPDGRYVEQRYTTRTSVIESLDALMKAGASKERILVVLDDDAYWPEFFPILRERRAAVGAVL
ncbi:hypothetical protein WH87_04580 [Devosia epidermidihirudinis]|uniref:Uncharacterized protein n=1 Tax=Devosia epidermidihirudinis TaxID=1293439 RepID=A0A0F5QFF9_9HYPH|nr:hypothetical protein [Devosia epidermidihirudinis]KKC39481.1 hypothetical protein WH87_04580 [Devosia epidermidihirudinis]